LLYSKAEPDNQGADGTGFVYTACVVLLVYGSWLWCSYMCRW